MKTVYVSNGQTIYDISNQYYGDVSYVGKILADNGLPSNGVLTVGQSLLVDDSAGVRSVKSFFSVNGEDANNYQANDGYHDAGFNTIVSDLDVNVESGEAIIGDEIHVTYYDDITVDAGVDYRVKFATNSLKSMDITQAVANRLDLSGQMTLRSLTTVGQLRVIDTGSTSNFADSCFIDSKEGYIVGENGTMLHTTDGGETFEEVDTGVTNIIYCMVYIPGYAYVCGMSGGNILVNYLDGNWVSVNIDTDLGNIYDICVVSQLEVYACSSSTQILRSTDGLSTWIQAAVVDTAPRRLSYYGGYLYIAANDGYVFKFNTSTMYYTSSKPSSGHVVSVYAMSDTKVFACGYGFASVSTDGAVTWTSLGLASNTYTLVTFYDQLNGYIVGFGGAAYNTVDGGASWTIQESGTTSNLRDACLVGANNVYLTGETGTLVKTSKPKIYRATLPCLCASSVYVDLSGCYTSGVTFGGLNRYYLSVYLDFSYNYLEECNIQSIMRKLLASNASVYSGNYKILKVNDNISSHGSITSTLKAKLERKGWTVTI